MTYAVAGAQIAEVQRAGRMDEDGDSVTKFVLIRPGADRCAAIGFGCAVGLAGADFFFAEDAGGAGEANHAVFPLLGCYLRALYA